MTRRPRTPVGVGRRLPVGSVLLVVLLYVAWTWTGRGPAHPEQAALRGDLAIADAFETRTSGVDVESAGTVVRLLADDRDGDRHQRFILRLATGTTLLVAHNIDLAPRVPVGVGDTLEFRGEYEWNAQGGVLHWTHHDPTGRRAGGWIRHRGRVYE